jgi:hypothetical protein
MRTNKKVQAKFQKKKKKKNATTEFGLVGIQNRQKFEWVYANTSHTENHLSQARVDSSGVRLKGNGNKTKSGFSHITITFDEMYK